MPSPVSREASSSAPLPNPYLGGAGVDYGNISFYPRSPSPSHGRQNSRASVRSAVRPSPSPSVLPSEGGSVTSASGESTQLQLAKIIQLLASKDVSMLHLNDRQKSMAHRVEETSTALDGVIERLSSKMDLIPELSEQLALQNAHHEALAKNLDAKMESFGTALSGVKAASSTIATLLDAGLRTLGGRMDAMEAAHQVALSKIDQLLIAVTEMRKPHADTISRRSQSRLPTPVESPPSVRTASPRLSLPASPHRQSTSTPSQTDDNGDGRPHKRPRTLEGSTGPQSDRPSQWSAATYPSASRSSLSPAVPPLSDHAMLPIPVEDNGEPNDAADMGHAPVDSHQAEFVDSNPENLFFDDRGLDDVEALLRSESPSSSHGGDDAGDEAVEPAGGQGHSNGELSNAREPTPTAGEGQSETPEAEEQKAGPTSSPSQSQTPALTPSGQRRFLRASQSIDYHSHPLDGVLHRGDLKKPGSAKLKAQLLPGRSRTFYGKVTVNDKCLPPSDGMKKGQGIWPRKGEFTVKGKIQEIICDCCKGRVHWACAGFQDKDEVDPDSSWDCPDCQAAMARGVERADIDMAPQDRCVRYNCICREKKATIRQPRDEDLYVVERIVGRKAIARRSDLSRVFMYLVKWAGWPVKDSTWEKEDEFPRSNKFVKDFVQAATAESVQLRLAVSILAEARPYLDDKGNFKFKREWESEEPSSAARPADRTETSQTQESAATSSAAGPSSHTAS